MEESTDPHQRKAGEVYEVDRFPVQVSRRSADCKHAQTRRRIKLAELVYICKEPIAVSDVFLIYSLQPDRAYAYEE